jgi:hypothetical protein
VQPGLCLFTQATHYPYMAEESSVVHTHMYRTKSLLYVTVISSNRCTPQALAVASSLFAAFDMQLRKSLISSRS